MTVTLGILALLEARAGKGEELADFLKAGRELAVAEEGTVTWYAFKISDTRYGIFDTFITDDARTAHINGQIQRRWPKCRPICWPGNRTFRPSTFWLSSNRPSQVRQWRHMRPVRTTTVAWSLTVSYSVTG
jgi:hypothetical protein